MSYKIEYPDNPFGVVTQFFGIVTDDEIRQSCIDRTTPDDRVKRYTYVLDDFTDVTEFLVTSEAVVDAAEFAIKASELNKNIQYLSIMPTDLLYGMSRMWHAYTEETQWHRNIVRTRKEADQWLKEHVFQSLTH